MSITSSGIESTTFRLIRAVLQLTGATTELQLKIRGHQDRPVHYLLC